MTSLLSIGTSIKNARKSERISIVELAERCGLNRNTIANLEVGRGNVELNTLISICHALQLNLTLTPERQENIPAPIEMKNETPLTKLLRDQILLPNALSAHSKPVDKIPRG